MRLLLFANNAEFYQISMDWLMGRTDVREVAR